MPSLRGALSGRNGSAFLGEVIHPHVPSALSSISTTPFRVPAMLVNPRARRLAPPRILTVPYIPDLETPSISKRAPETRRNNRNNGVKVSGTKIITVLKRQRSKLLRVVDENVRFQLAESRGRIRLFHFCTAAASRILRGFYGHFLYSELAAAHAINAPINLPFKHHHEPRPSLKRGILLNNAPADSRGS
jgi:hypothetical protein